MSIAGERFGELVAIEMVGRYRGHQLWKCRCDCGKETVARRSDLRGDIRVSCGCKKYRTPRLCSTKHGMSAIPEYQIWLDMRYRCINPNHKQFKDYGGRGITVCARWESFENFIIDMGVRTSPMLTLDRKNNDLGYSPDNCRWATRKEQAANRRKTPNQNKKDSSNE